MTVPARAPERPPPSGSLPISAKRSEGRLPRPTLATRASGLLLHPTSLPVAAPGHAARSSQHRATGTLGPAALEFLDFLGDAGARWWQMLPVAPTGFEDSPYSALSAFAGSPSLVSVERLAADGLLTATEARTLEHGDALARAFQAFSAPGAGEAARAATHAFQDANRAWLPDFALFRALKRAHGEVQWTLWPAPLRDRAPEALAEASRRFAAEIAFHEFEQLRFQDDWRALRDAAEARGLALIGDLPIFVAHDSADVWQHRELFHLDARGEPTVVAGVPPDYFSATGQRWGNPLYRWPRLRHDGFAWWVARFRMMLSRFDAVRLDHFIGFSRYWEIPAGEPTAVKGRWVKGPGAPLFEAVRAALGGTLPLIAEDLGVVTPKVTNLRLRFGLPGLKIFQFAFGTDPQGPSFLPHNYPRRTVAYTGTHDNDTAAGWFHDLGGPDTPRSAEQAAHERQALLRYLGGESSEPIHWRMIRAVMQSVANLAVIPVQDVLGLGSEARMNRPGIAAGNWRWHLRGGELTPAVAARFRDLAETYGRVAPRTDSGAS